MKITLIGGPRDGDVIEISDTPAIVKLHGAVARDPGPTWTYAIDRRSRTATYEPPTETQT